MKKTAENKIILIDPLTSFDSVNTVGIAYLRGSLEKNNTETKVLNFNRIIDSSFEIKYKNLIKKILQEQKISSINNSFLKKLSLYFLIIRLYYFGPKIIWKAVQKINLFNKIFDCYKKEFQSVSYVGISVTYSEQVLFSLILIQYIKRNYPNIKIIIGGSLVTSCINDMKKLFSYNPIVDFIVTGEGETPLLNILKQNSEDTIPNIYYFKNNCYKKSNFSCHFENFNKLPSPIFEENDRLFLQYSRKCYWGKCIYCTADNNHFDLKLAHRDIKRIVDDIKTNNALLKSNSVHYRFVDSSLSKKFFIDFYNSIKEEPTIKNSFYGWLRFDSWVDKDILNLAKKSGFTHLSCGIETSVPRLQKIIKKGYEMNVVRRILDHCQELNFQLCIMFIVGLPTQTRSELHHDLLTIKKLLKKYPNIFHLEITPLSINRGTDIYKNANEYHIQVLKKMNLFLVNHYAFRQLKENAISTQEATEITKKFIKENLKKYKNKVFLWA
ncbi:MAG: B12-binding domain-containing radical SAM protein [Promethearchaeota archaeon]